MGNFRRNMLAFLALVGGTVAVVIAVQTVSDFGRKDSLDSKLANQGVIQLGEQMDDSRSTREKQSRPRPLLRIAVAPVISPEKTFVDYRNFVEYLASKMGRKGSLIVRSTYAEINELLRENRCDAALICTLAYIRGRREFGLNLLAAPVVKGDIHYHSQIVVPSRSKDQSLLDLQGKLFASADILSTSGWLYPGAWLIRRKINPLRFFKKLVLTGSHDRSILAVANGEVDGAAVHSIVHQQMPEKIKKKVRIIHTSPAFGIPPMVTPNQLDDSTRMALQHALLKMDKDPLGREILSMLEIDRFELVDPSLYNSIEALEAQWQTRK
jgi:phosphonate transport system substrate-binding protein